MNANVKNVKKLLLVVDLNNGFTKQGAMADPFIQHIVPESRRLVKHFLKKGYMVGYIKDWHDEQSVEFKRYPGHCKGGTYEAQMVDELLEFESEVVVFKKNSTSAMFAEGFMEMLSKMEQLEEVVIIGCCTDVCVINLAIPLQNYFDEHNRCVKIIIPKNAVETYNSPTHPREEYNEIAFKLLIQTGITLVEKYC